MSAPSVGPEELKLVTEAIESGWISSRGPFLTEFESAFARYVRGREGVATTSGTTALHLAFAALRIKPGDEVIVPDFTIVACANAVLYGGATPVFADVDPITWTLDPADVERKITRRTKAIMPVHLYGHPADMDPLRRLARERGLAVVEDAAEAHGALYRGTPVGSIGTAGCFSFYSNKILTTGEGGMVVTRSKALADRARRLRDLAFAHPNRDYQHAEVAYNYRMTNVQAAIGLAQLRRIDAFVEHRRACARIYADRLDGIDGLTLPAEASWARNVYWMYTVLVPGGAARRARIARRLAASGVESRVSFWPLHRQPFLRAGRGARGRFPVTDDLARRGLSLPSGNGITEAMAATAAEAMRQALRDGGR
ncbi:MAG TPA: DegT/DnrJ/EryC1/StrS family aminotransferase [Thermoplasmata archaeon]